MPRLLLQPAGGGPAIQAEVEGAGAASGERGALTVSVGERTLHVHGAVGPDGEGVLRLDVRTLPFYAARVGDELHLWLEGELYRFTLPRHGRAARTGHDALPTSGEVAAPMPGRVLQVLVEPGQGVAARAPLAIIESMKTELTVSAPAAGMVREVRCAPGDMVDRDQVLVTLAAEAAPVDGGPGHS